MVTLEWLFSAWPTRHSRLDWPGLNVAAFTLGVGDGISSRCGWAKYSMGVHREADGAACEASGERLGPVTARKSALEPWSEGKGPGRVVGDGSGDGVRGFTA